MRAFCSRTSVSSSCWRRCIACISAAVGVWAPASSGQPATTIAPILRIFTRTPSTGARHRCALDGAQSYFGRSQWDVAVRGNPIVAPTLARLLARLQLLAVHAHVIDLEAGREVRVVDAVATSPVATDGEIEQHRRVRGRRARVVDPPV